ncbi:FAD-dependent oxidoreductase [Bradyrhizobium sp.]|uniref:FAD-dependent oxidoreductase n=1 Tax=Bradyrhizobium sp. TaxID=376 RepID=UPI003BB104D6
MKRPLKVTIIGAGTGGLCLAHGLQSDGVAVEVFERDHSPADRQQGFRLSINATGGAALRSCLPQALFDKLAASSADPSEGLTFLDHRLNRLLAIDFPHNERSDADAERPISRAALRRILLEGLDGIVRFGRKFTGFEDGADGSVVAHFADGTTASGDVLIGADGAGSKLRSQLLPHARRVETGIMAVSGKVDLNDANRALVPPPVLRGPTPILGPRGCFMFASAVQYRDGERPARNDTFHDEREEYVMWGFSAHRAKFGSADPDRLGGEKLKAAVLGLMQDWHPSAMRLVQAADASAVSAFAVKTSVPIPPWRTRNVTLLGDALHNMTPFRGIGANTALRDAAALRNALVIVDRGERDLVPALADYERDMIDYGFAAVRASLADMERFHADRPLSRALTKAAFRAADWIPPLKAALMGGR